MKLDLQLGKFSLKFGKEPAKLPGYRPAVRGNSESRGQKMTVTSTGPQRVGAPDFSRMYAGAQVSRLTADWGISITSANAEILVSAIALVSRNRQLERDDDYFRKMLALLENNVIGDEGLKLRCLTKGPDGSHDKDLIAKVHEAWHDYLHEENCTIMGNMGGVELQRMAIRRLAVDGGCLFRIYPAFANEFGFALEPIEIDRLDHNWSRPAAGSSNEIQFGIEVDKFKRHVAYWILTRHPGDVFAWRSGPKYRERVPASQIIYVRCVERFGQWKGMPLWPSVGTRLNHLDKYEISEVIAAREASSKGGWFKKTNENAQYVGEGEDAAGNKISDTQPGQWEELPLGWDPVQRDPQHPNGNYPGFVKCALRGASAGSGNPYNSVAEDLEGVNYSSIRAGLLDSRDGYRWMQKIGAHKLMRPWFRAWLPFAILSGKLDIGMENLERVFKHKWAGRGWPWVDPLKDVQAALLAVDGGIASRRSVIAKEGRDIEEVFEEIQEDEALAEEHGIVFSTPEKPIVESEEEEPPEVGGGSAGKPKVGNGEPGKTNGNGNGGSKARRFAY